MLKTCQYGDCLEEIGEKGVIVTLKTPTFDEEKRAGYCCASHAASALMRLSMDRKEPATLDVALAYCEAEYEAKMHRRQPEHDRYLDSLDVLRSRCVRADAVRRGWRCA
jgi:hypothetical protein